MATKETVIQKAEEFLGELRSHLMGVIETATTVAAPAVEAAAQTVEKDAPAVAAVADVVVPVAAPIVAAAEPIVEASAQEVASVAEKVVAPEPGYKYAVVNDGDTLPSLEAKLDTANLFQQNMDAIDSAARAAGHPAGSNGGEILVPGTVLKYR